MRILKPSNLNKKKFKRYYGRCSNCGCEFSIDETEVHYSNDYYFPYYYCPERKCRQVTHVYSKRKYIPK